MIKALNIFVIAFAMLIVSTAGAHAQYAVKDSFYFMKDDNEFSPEEKDEETEYVYGLCEANPFQKIYYDCSCIAGAFRMERDKVDLVPQSQIINALFKDKDLGCTNKVAVAGETYEYCQSYHMFSQPRAKQEERESYCSCVANRAANDFARNPSLAPYRLRSLKTDAMTYCTNKPKR